MKTVTLTQAIDRTLVDVNPDHVVAFYKTDDTTTLILSATNMSGCINISVIENVKRVRHLFNCK